MVRPHSSQVRYEGSSLRYIHSNRRAWQFGQESQSFNTGGRAPGELFSPAPLPRALGLVPRALGFSPEARDGLDPLGGFSPDPVSPLPPFLTLPGVILFNSGSREVRGGRLGGGADRAKL